MGLLKSVGFRFCRPLQELEKAEHVLRYFVDARSIGCKPGCQITIDHRASHLGKQMGATWRPAHVLALAHACIYHLVHRRFRHSRRNRLVLTIVLPVGDRRTVVAFQVSEQLVEAIGELLEAPRESLRLWHNDATEQRDLPHSLLRFCSVPMPEAPAPSVDGSLHRSLP